MNERIVSMCGGQLGSIQTLVVKTVIGLVTAGLAAWVLLMTLLASSCSSDRAGRQNNVDDAKSRPAGQVYRGYERGDSED